MKFSIGIPAYKASFLKECVDSVINQTYPDFELIIVNDASPQDIEGIIMTYTDQRIRYFKNARNFGAENVVDNWNKCLSYAQGDFFLLLGDDDRLESNFLSEFLSLIKQHPDLDVYHCRSIIIDDHSRSVGVTASWPEFETVYENIWHRNNTNRLQFVSDFLYRTTVLKQNGGYYKLPLAWGSDDISAYIAIGNKGIAHTNKPIFNYRRNDQTISSSGSIHLKLNALMQQSQWLSQFLNHPPLDSLDQIFYENIQAEKRKIIQKKKILTISKSYKKGVGSQFFYWILNKSKYDLTFAEIAYSLIEYAKQKATKNN